jgi:hypothetical protein
MIATVGLSVWCMRCAREQEADETALLRVPEPSPFGGPRRRNRWDINTHTIITVWFVWGVCDSCRGLLRRSVSDVGTRAKQAQQLKSAYLDERRRRQVCCAAIWLN